MYSNPDSPKNGILYSHVHTTTKLLSRPNFLFGEATDQMTTPFRTNQAIHKVKPIRCACLPHIFDRQDEAPIDHMGVVVSIGSVQRKQKVASESS